MAFLSSGPLWPAAVRAAIPAAEVEVHRAAPTAVRVGIECHVRRAQVEVTLIARTNRVGSAWGAAVVLSRWWPDLLGPAGVSLQVSLPGMEFLSAPDVMLDVAAGWCDRRTWLNRTIATIG